MSQKTRSVAPEAWEEEAGCLRAGEAVGQPWEVPVLLLPRDRWGARSQGPRSGCLLGDGASGLGHGWLAGCFWRTWTHQESEWGCGGWDISRGTVLLGEGFQTSWTKSSNWGTHTPWLARAPGVWRWGFQQCHWEPFCGLVHGRQGSGISGITSLGMVAACFRMAELSK